MRTFLLGEPFSILAHSTLGFSAFPADLRSRSRFPGRSRRYSGQNPGLFLILPFFRTSNTTLLIWMFGARTTLSVNYLTRTPACALLLARRRSRRPS